VTRLRAGAPAQLEFEFVPTAGAFVLDVERGVRRDAEPLVGDLDRETLAGLQRVGQPTSAAVGCIAWFGVPLLPQELPHLVEATAPTRQVQDRVAVRAHRPQVLDRINHVLAADLG
jgi:hypothetical protein